MSLKKHALVLFTKYPEPGRTKTRLIEMNGGTLSEVEAAELYRAMVLDTADVGLHAVDRCRHAKGEEFSFCVSSSPAEHMPRVREMFGSEFPSSPIVYILDRGSNFDEHFNSCFCQLFDQGYDSVVCIGGDLPGLSPGLIFRAFESLGELAAGAGRGAMALAPCQAGGVSLVGITQGAPVDFTGVFYNAQGVTALDALVSLAALNEIPLALLETVYDVDYVQDLAHATSVINAMSYAARFQEDIVVPKRTLEFICKNGIVANSAPTESRDPRDLLDSAEQAISQPTME